MGQKHNSYNFLAFAEWLHLEDIYPIALQLSHMNVQKICEVISLSFLISD
jgi:hypothetical protein